MAEMLRDWWPAILFATNLGIGWVVWSFKKGVASKEDLEVQGERIGKVETRIELLEREIEHLPTSRDVCALREEIAGLSALRRAADDAVSRLATAVGRIEQYLLERK